MLVLVILCDTKKPQTHCNVSVMSGLVEHQIAIDGFTHTNNTKESILRNPQICSKPKKKRIVLSTITFQRSESQMPFTF